MLCAPGGRLEAAPQPGSVRVVQGSWALLRYSPTSWPSGGMTDTRALSPAGRFAASSGPLKACGLWLRPSALSSLEQGEWGGKLRLGELPGTAPRQGERGGSAFLHWKGPPPVYTLAYQLLHLCSTAERGCSPHFKRLREVRQLAQGHTAISRPI